MGRIRSDTTLKKRTILRKQGINDTTLSNHAKNNKAPYYAIGGDRILVQHNGKPKMITTQFEDIFPIVITDSDKIEQTIRDSINCHADQELGSIIYKFFCKVAHQMCSVYIFEATFRQYIHHKHCNSDLLTIHAENFQLRQLSVFNQ